MNTRDLPTQPSPPRGRGRPPAQDDADPRAELLDQAETMFSERGYAATSVRSIAEAAGVTPAMVHYYFGSKRELLIAVLDRVLQPLMDALAELRESGENDIRPVFEMACHTMAEHPALPRLVTREALLPGGELGPYFAEHYAPRLGGALPPLIDRAQIAGRIDDDMDPRVLTLFLLGLCMFPFIARPLAEPVLGMDYGRDGWAAYVRQAWRVFEHGVTP